MITAIKDGMGQWIGDARKSVSIDMIAGFTLWAMIVPEAVAYANMADAPTSAAGLYGIMICLPIYALFASSRYLVATSTSAISVTTAGFLATLSGNPAEVFSALVVATAIIYLVFWYFRLGFVADFISEPVSRGFMIGLSLFIVIGQLPKVFGVEKTEGNSFQQAWGLVQNIGSTHVPTLLTGIAVLIVLSGSHMINRRIPGGLIALVLCMVLFAAVPAVRNSGVEMVGALPAGLPAPTLPMVSFAELPVIFAAATGLVILATSEATVLASSLALAHGQKLDVDRQFFAFGTANLAGGFFGGLMSAGSTSSTLVNHAAGAKTLMSTIWAAGLTLLTILFLTGLFAYLPEAFLGVLIIHAVWHLLQFRKILKVRRYSLGEFNLAAISLLSVLLFDVLYGLIIAMMLNVVYFAYTTSRVKVAALGTQADSRHILMPLGLDGVEPPPKDCVALGLTHGQIFYASARSALQQAGDIISAHPDATKVVISVERLSNLDFTSHEILREFEDLVRKSGKQLFITNIRSQRVLDQLEAAKFDPAVVNVSEKLDITKL